MRTEVNFRGRNCLACGKPLVGRMDKKFCDTYCRSIFHNRSKRTHERLIIETNQNLRKNRTILKTLCPQGKATVRRSIARDMGFSFEIFTSIFPTKGQLYYFSYEYGYMPILDKRGVQKMVIVQMQPNKHVSIYDPWQYVKRA